MDREEVIKWLTIMKANLNNFPEISNSKKIKALGEAIRLLKNEQPELPTSSATKDDLGVDCIVDVLGSYTDLDIPYKREIAENILTKLPSVTPQEPILDRVRAEIAEYGSIMVSYAITKDTKTDKGIEKLVSGVLKQAKEQVLEIIDKYRAEVEE